MTLQERINQLERINAVHRLKEIALEQEILWLELELQSWQDAVANWQQTAIAALAKAESLEQRPSLDR